MTKRTILRTEADAIAYLAQHEPETKIENGRAIVTKICWRCGGSGKFGPLQIENGDCFACTCQGLSPVQKLRLKVLDHARDVRNKATAEARKERKRAAGEANRSARALAAEARKLEGQRRWCEEHGHGPITFAELDAKRAAEDEAKASKMRHIGTVGKREEFEVTFERFHRLEDIRVGYQNISRWLLVFADEDGNELVWFTSGGIGGAEKGDKIKIRATVKEHGEHSGKPQTVITRAKRIEA